MKTQFITVWKLIPHHIDKEMGLTWARKNQRIAIGWGMATTDIKLAAYQNQREIADTIQAAFRRGTFPRRNWTEGGLSLWALAHEMKIGDLVIISGNAPRQLVVRVTGDYEWQKQKDPLLGDYQHQRKVELTLLDPSAVWQLAGGKVEAGRSPYATLARCANTFDLLA